MTGLEACHSREGDLFCHSRESLLNRHSREGGNLVVFLFLFLLLASSLQAAGLTLYSYQDDQGQTIVVDSLERVPEPYRDSARQNFIPSFKTGKSRVRPSSPETPAVEDNRVVVIAAPETAAELGSRPVVVEPIEEILPPDPALASAAAILSKIKQVVDNNELLYGLTLRFTIRHPAVQHQHLTNLIELRNLPDPKKLVWIEPNNWAVEADLLIERLRSTQFTVSSWFETGSGALLTTLPTLVEAAKRHTALIERRLKELEAADLARREKELADRKQKRRLKNSK